MKFSLRALFCITTIAGAALVFPLGVAWALIILIVCGLAISFLIPIEGDHDEFVP